MCNARFVEMASNSSHVCLFGLLLIFVVFFVDFSLCLCGRRVGSFFQTLDEFLGDVQSDGKSPARLALLLP